MQGLTCREQIWRLFQNKHFHFLAIIALNVANTTCPLLTAGLHFLAINPLQFNILLNLKMIIGFNLV